MRAEHPGYHKIMNGRNVQFGDAHSHHSFEHTIGVEDLKGKVPQVRDDDSPVRPDIQLLGPAELAGAFAGTADLAQKAAAGVDGDHASRGVKEVQVASLVEARGRNGPQNLPVGHRARRPEAVDLHEFGGQRSILPWEFDHLLGVTASRNRRREECGKERSVHSTQAPHRVDGFSIPVSALLSCSTA